MTSTLTAYWRERFRPVVFAPIAFGIAAAAQVGAPFDWARYATDCALALLLLAQFRLWDDIADAERDRVNHPQRVLVRAGSLGSYVAVCCLLTGLNGVLVLGLRGMAANTILATLDLAFATFYAARPANRRAFVDAIVLLKYPTFIAILARDISFEVLSLAAAIFALACVFEAWHDSPSSVRLHADRPPAPRIPL